MQVILNQNEDNEVIILTKDDKRKVFIRNKQNKDCKEWVLFQNIVDLVNQYFSK